MPKIGSFRTTITANNITHDFIYDIMYNQKDKFNISIPQELNESFDLLSYEEYQQFGIVVNKKNIIRAVYAVTQEGVEDRFSALVKKLLESSCSSRDVIVVYMQNKDFGDNDCTSEFKSGLAGFRMRFTYCTEKVFPGSEPKYYIFRKGSAIMGGYTTKEVVSVHCSGKDTVTVIDDTPENRLFLENIHAAINTLHEKIKSITRTPEELVGFIESKQLLLSNQQKT